MNAKMRRVTTSGMLLLAALSFGCGQDAHQSVLDMGPVGALPQPAVVAGIGTTRSAQVVSGNAADVDTANMAVNGLFALIRGGALQAASPTGGIVADGSTMQLAALAPAPAEAPVASDAELPHVQGIRSLKRLLVANVAPTFTFDGDTLRVSAVDGTQLVITGVSPLPAVDADPSTPPPLGFTLSSDVSATGTVFGDGGPHPVNLRVRGLTGTLRFVQDQDPIPDLTIGASGIVVSGTIDEFGGTVSASGASGHFTTLSELNGLLSGTTLSVRLSEVRVRDFFANGQAQLTISNLQLPVHTERPTGRVFGSGDVTFDPHLPFAHNGQIVHAAFEIPADKSLVFDASTDGPQSGTLVASVHHASSSVTDTLTITFHNGEPHVSGQLTNVSGTPETVTTAGDTTTATGSIAFTDGRKADHTIEVRRRTGGRRAIVFTVAIKSKEGLQVLHMIGAVRRDKGLAGTWARSVPAAAGTPITTAQPQPLQVDPEKSGSFRVSADGQLELVAESGAILAKGPMPADWNKGL